MNRILFLLMIIHAFIIGTKGYGQTYFLRHLPNEGVRINGVPIHNNKDAQRSYSNLDIIEVSDAVYCEILKEGVDGDLHYVSRCCTKKGKKMEDVFNFVQRFHIKLKHKRNKEPYIQTEVTTKAITTVRDLYQYFGFRPKPSDAFFEQIDKLKELKVPDEDVLIELRDNCLFFMNQGEKLYVVAYISDGKQEVKRLPLTRIDKGQEKKLGAIEKNQKEVFVFYCGDRDEYWDCLDIRSTKPFKCCRKNLKNK